MLAQPEGATLEITRASDRVIISGISFVGEEGDGTMVGAEFSLSAECDPASVRSGVQRVLDVMAGLASPGGSEDSQEMEAPPDKS